MRYFFTHKSKFSDNFCIEHKNYRRILLKKSFDRANLINANKKIGKDKWHETTSLFKALRTS